MRSVFIQQADLPQFSYFLHHLKSLPEQWTVYCSLRRPEAAQKLRKLYPSFKFVQPGANIESIVEECTDYVLVADQVRETLYLLELIKSQQQQEFNEFCYKEPTSASLKLPTAQLFSSKTVTAQKAT